MQCAVHVSSYLALCVVSVCACACICLLCTCVGSMVMSSDYTGVVQEFMNVYLQKQIQQK